MNFVTWYNERHDQLPQRSIDAVIALATEGSTVPFIARYRKEQTGNLDEVAIQNIIDGKEKWEYILKRQEYIVSEIDKQKKLTPELAKSIQECFSPEVLEDLYLPYKVKRKSKATKAKEAGLEPLADWIWNCGQGTEEPQPGQTLELWAFTFRNEKAEINDAAAAIAGAQDILIERIAETQSLRQKVRVDFMEKGAVKSEKTDKAQKNSKYDKYFEFQEPVSTLKLPQNSHRYMALRRGWLEEELRLQVTGDDNGRTFEESHIALFQDYACKKADSPGADVLKKAARLAYKAHVFPSIETEVHNMLKTIADEAAIGVFAENLRKLLLAPPYGSKSVLGVDPGIRTGCKLAFVDASGKYQVDSVIHLQTENERAQAKKMLIEACGKVQISAIAVGNGTNGRETELFIRTVFKEAGIQIPVIMVNEAGASVYSASEVAREEFPKLDVTVRGAISIARRLQDPLAELVKIDPKSIGVGQYQHDVSPTALKRSLENVVDSCVNAVGVDLNTASDYLLSHVSGIGPGLAKSIIEYRNVKGLFKSRQQLLEIGRFTKKIFEQSAGFLRIRNGDHILDNTGVHPERYEVLSDAVQSAGKSLSDFIGSGASKLKDVAGLKDKLGEFTFNDIMKELEKPGRDPRDGFSAFSFREDIHEVQDLKPSMICPGIVTNVTNFGAFVDIGVHQDGLVHISQLSHKFIQDPREVVNPGDQVKVKVLEVNLEKNQIALTMRLEDKPAQREANPVEARASKASHGGHNRPQANKPGASGDRRPHQGGGKTPPPPKAKFTNSPFAGLANLLKK